MKKESGLNALKRQLGRESALIIRAVADAGVPVMSHISLLSHKAHQVGGFKMQGSMADAAMEAVENARAIEAAGAIGLEIEATPFEVGRALDDSVDTFTFSIGAGAAATRRLLNGHDFPGAIDTFKPKFAGRYANIAQIATQAFAKYARDARSGAFPDAVQGYQMTQDETERVSALLNREDPA